MSCAQVAGMTTAGLVAMRSSCPRNPPGTTTTKRKKDKEGYGAEVLKPGPHDVLLGRGGGTNNHNGNINFRKLVNEHKMRYLACSKIEKPNVAREVVELWKKLDPPGRFLSRKDEGQKKGGDEREGPVVWIEVPEKKAREKASQCLRERTPDVVPYIRQLREQQDQMTEQGVSMVQQQLKMQREAEAHKNSLHGMAAAAAQYSRRNSLAENNPYQNPMIAMSNPEFAGRRGSMPMMQGSGNGMMMNMQQQTSFNRRGSAPHLNSGSNHGAMPSNAAAMMGQMSPQFAGSGMMEPGFVGSDGMYDPSYASSMTAMQLQNHHQQQLQLQQMQQQQMMQHQQMMQQQQMAQANMQAANQMNMRTPRSMMQGQGMNQQQWNMQPMNNMSAQNGGMPSQSGHGSGSQLNHSDRSHSTRDNSSSHHSGRARVPDAPKSGNSTAFESPAPDKNKSADFAPRQDSPVPPQGNAAADPPADSPPQPKRSKSPKRAVTADRTPQAPSRAPAPSLVTPPSAPAPPADDDEGDIPLPFNDTGIDAGDDVVGIDDYRKTLESYMVNNNIQANNPIYYSDDDLSVESFPDWPDEGDHPERDEPPKRRGREAPASRKVDRHKSGHSMMSCKTFKSNGTSLSGLSMLSDMMSMESSKISRDDKMGASKRFSSNASIMSELTDISHTIDGLGLDDDI